MIPTRADIRAVRWASERLNPTLDFTLRRLHVVDSLVAVFADIVTGKLAVREAETTLPTLTGDAYTEPAPNETSEEIADEPEETNDANN